MALNEIAWVRRGLEKRKELIIKVILMFPGSNERARELARQTESNINAKYSMKNELERSKPGRD